MQRGNTGGVLIGTEVLVVIGNIIVLGGVNVYWQQISSGVIVILAIIMDSMIRKFDKR